jgi:hypothetical protein
MWKQMSDFTKWSTNHPLKTTATRVGIFHRENKYLPKQQKVALKSYFKTHRIEGHGSKDFVVFLDTVRPRVEDVLSQQKKPIKMKLILACVYERVNPATGAKVMTFSYFHSAIETITEATIISKLNIYEKIIESADTYQNKGSGWVFREVSYLDIHIDKYRPLNGGSSYVPLPKVLADKKAIINMKNEDNECFKWSVTTAIYHETKVRERISKKLRVDAKKFDWTGIEFPVTLKQINLFEKNNDFAVNVYGYEEYVYSLRISKCVGRQVIDLLLISGEGNNHYCWIKNKSRLLSSQVNNNQHKILICDGCLNSFRSEESLRKHLEYCSNHEAVRAELPKEGTMLRFENHNNSMRVPFVIYADFECFTESISTVTPSGEKSHTVKYQKHTPSGFCFLIKAIDNIFKPILVTYTAKSEDDDVSQMFVDSLEREVKVIYENHKSKELVRISMGEMTNYKNAVDCHICKGALDGDKVLDHCHLTGNYRGAAHNKCNLHYKIPTFYPVIFHNLSGYDAHLFIRNLGVTEGDIKCIPNNEEKYISFTKEIVVDSFVSKDGKEKEVKRSIRFVDSLKFMSSSLGNLVSNLEKEDFENMRGFYEGNELDLLLRKGVYPYDYMNSFGKLGDKELPSRVAFYSKLNGTDVSVEEYEHAQNVWKTFGMKSMREYHDLYLKTDVILLADVFENFRDVCMKNYELDPCWYYTSPGLAWDACLKKTEIELELLSDIDMVLMVEEGIRGGVSMISTRYGEANNKYMDTYDESKSPKYIQYLDANNLYGWAMSQKMPTHRFKWMNESEIENWKKHPCILEVDLEYPTQYHNLHNDYPLAPERLTIRGVEKLVPNLRNKTKYVVHHETLKAYEGLGLRITKVHRAIKFEESAWMKQYIDLNTQLRTVAKNDFEKDFFKLMNNSVFGKTMENIRNRVDIQLVTTEKKAKKLISKPNYKSRTIFSENLVAVHMEKTKLTHDKPIYLGMSILDLSKNLMYDFHYDYVKTKWGEKAKLLFTDTDSLMYEIETEDFYEDIKEDIHTRFDTSNFPKDHSSNVETGANKKVIGMFKDEAGGKVISEFVGLRAKLYSYKCEEKEEKRCKGVKKAVVKKDITFEDYKKCLFGGGKVHRKMNVIRSHCHDIYSEEVNKVALSREDDKRVIQEDGIHTKAIGSSQ